MKTALITIVILSLFVIYTSGKNEAETEDIYETFEYETINAGGRVWMDRNLGAKLACTSAVGDQDCLGYLYQWGRSSDGHQKIDSDIVKGISSTITPNHSKFIVVNTTSDDYRKIINWLNNDDTTLWTDKGGINNVCPTGWHVASKEDFEALNILNATDAFKKIKMAGNILRFGIVYYNNGGKFLYNNSSANVWTSTTSREYSVSFDAHNINDGGAGFAPTSRVSGHAVRCVMN